MKKNWLSRLLPMGMIAMFLASCSSDSDYLRVIPENVPFLVSMNADAIATKAGLDEDTELTSKLSALAKLGLRSATSNLVDQLIENPDQSGIDFEEPLYLFMLNDMETPAIVAKMEDEENFSDLLKVMNGENFCSAIQEGEEYSYVKLMDDNGIVAFSEDAILIVGANYSTDTEMLDSTIAELMNQEEDNSILANEGFDAMRELDGDIHFYTSLEEFIALAPNATKEEILALYDEVGIDFNSISYIGSWGFYNGATTIKATYYTDNKEMEKELKTLAKKLSPTIEDGFLSKFPSTTLGLFSLGLDGKEYESYMKELQVLEKAVGNEIPIEIVYNALAAVDGDLTMGLLDDEPHFLAFAHVNDDDIVEKVLQDMNVFDSSSLLDLGDNNYYLGSGYGEGIFFGVENHNFYITNAESTDNIVDGYRNSMANIPYTANAKDYSFFAVANGEAILDLRVVKRSLRGAPDPIVELAEGFSHAEMCVNPNNMVVEMKLVMKDKDKNILATVFDCIKEVVEESL